MDLDLVSYNSTCIVLPNIITTIFSYPVWLMHSVSSLFVTRMESSLENSLKIVCDNNAKELTSKRECNCVGVGLAFMLLSNCLALHCLIQRHPS